MLNLSFDFNCQHLFPSLSRRSHADYEGVTESSSGDAALLIFWGLSSAGTNPALCLDLSSGLSASSLPASSHPCPLPSPPLEYSLITVFLEETVAKN